MKLLHVVATPRIAKSHTLRVSGPFVDTVRANVPDVQVETLDLFGEGLPAVAGDNIEIKYGLMVGRPIDRKHAESWRQIETLIEQFLAADLCLISAPMWNFSIPYALKYYIDAIVQPGYLFGIDAAGVPVGLCQGKSLVVVTSRGADYSGPMAAFDHQVEYLKTIFGFLGITNLHFIHAQPMDQTLELREAAIAEAVRDATALAAELAQQRTRTPLLVRA